MNAQQQTLDQAQGPNGPSTPEAMATYLDANEAITSAALTQLKALPQPDDPELAAIYAEAAQLDQLAAQAARAVRAGDQASFDTLTAQAETVGKKADADSIAYGLEECGKDLNTSNA